MYSIIRRTWKKVLALAIAGLMFGLLVPLNEAAVGAWAMATLVIGVLCGTEVFGGKLVDNSNHSPVGKKPSAGELWLIQTAFWFASATVTGMLILQAFFLRLLLREAYQQLPWSRLLETPFWQLPSAGTLLTLWLITGFSIGQFFSMFWRKSGVATVVSLVVCVAVSGLWLPSLAGGGLRGWQVFGVPAILLAATRLGMRARMAGQLSSRRPALLSAASGLLAVAWLAGCLWYRVAEIPDVGEPFDVNAFRASVSSLNANQAPKAIKTAIQEFAVKENGRVPPELSGGHILLLIKVLQKGWPANEGEPGKSLDVLFARTWAKHLREAVELPQGPLFPPESETSLSHESRFSFDWLARVAAWSLAARALQVQARGDSSTSLDHLLTVLMLSRHLRNKARTHSYICGLVVEGAAVEGFDRWLERLEPEPKLLRRAVDELARHQHAVPPFGDSLKMEYLAMLQHFNNSRIQHLLDLEMWALLQQSIFEPEAQLAITWYVPWERRRLERITNLACAGWLRSAEAEYSQILNQKFEDLEDPRYVDWYWVGDWLPPKAGPGSSLTRQQLAHLMKSWPLSELGSETRYTDRLGWTCGMRATLLKLALALYQFQEKKPAPNLDVLVPRYLPEVPIDPYSGKPFRYRVSVGEDITELNFEEDSLQLNRGPKEQTRHISAGQGVFWSVGLDGVDNGGLKNGIAFDIPEWMSGGYDLIFVVPQWPKAEGK